MCVLVTHDCPNLHTKCRLSMPGDEMSSRSLQKGDLSEQTILQHLNIQFCCSAHQSHRLTLCCIVKRIRSNGHRDDSPLCKRCRIVRVDTERDVNTPIS
ncbi:hypothetical protein TNCV_1765001 [Trichonephila clavipes]|nr:hypothetical protein TNCV_1765001 [Trichonephila clavipes]